MKRLKPLYAILCLLLFLPLLSQAQKTKARPTKAVIAAKNKTLAKSMLWEISGNGLKQPSYLYGTYHLLSDSYLNSVPVVKERFQQSNGVVVEVEIDSAAMKQMSTKVLMTDNKISTLLSPEDFSLVGKEVKQTIGYELTMLDQMKPISLFLMLSMTEYQKLDVVKQYAGKPLDSYFAAQGKKDGKKVTSLETIEHQLDLLYDHHPVAIQANQLVNYVKQKEEVLKIQNQLTDLYFTKDLNGMWNAYVAYSKLTGDEDMAYMVDDRNKNWIMKLPAIMQERSTFVAVGALHLPGENGLIQLLQKAGYKVKPLQ
jgi:uncharacterized protein YbaP (TraB family)